MTSEQEPQGKTSTETTRSLSIREYLGLLRPQKRQLTEKEIAELAANPDKPLSWREYLGLIFR